MWKKMVKVWPQGRPRIVPGIECRYVTVEVDGEVWIVAVELSVDEAARRMAYRAVKNRNGKSVDGPVTVRRHRKVESTGKGSEHAENQ